MVSVAKGIPLKDLSEEKENFGSDLGWKNLWIIFVKSKLFFNNSVNSYFENFNPDSDFGSLYDSSYYSEHGLFSSTSTTTSTTSVSSTPFEVSTVMYEGEIVNCLTRPIRCYEIREREEANSRTVTHTPKTENSKFDTTTKYWETTDQTVKIDWVS